MYKYRSLFCQTPALPALLDLFSRGTGWASAGFASSALAGDFLPPSLLSAVLFDIMVK
jgi:hypothetical protein